MIVRRLKDCWKGGVYFVVLRSLDYFKQTVWRVEALIAQKQHQSGVCCTLHNIQKNEFLYQDPIKGKALLAQKQHQSGVCCTLHNIRKNESLYQDPIKGLLAFPLGWIHMHLASKSSNMCAHTHACTHARTHAHACTHARTHARTQIHTHAYTHTHARPHTYAHTHIHTHHVNNRTLVAFG